MAHQTPLPFRQGELDGLCGIYAIINAIRLVLGPRASLLKPADWHELFVVLLESIDGPIGAAHAAANGIETKPLRSLLRVASLHLVAELDLTVRAAPMFPRNDRPSFAELLQHHRACIQPARPCGAAIGVRHAKSLDSGSER